MNKNNPLISIVVPVYKAENYLHRCVDSLLAQTFQDYEVLLIDDGSPDRSGVICDEYAQKDRRVRVFHKENGGVSSARNYGIEQASGNWITFVDSDDWVSYDFLEAFGNKLFHGENTLYLQGMQMFTVHKALSPLFSYNDSFYSIEDNVENFVSEKILANGCPVAKLFNIGVLNSNEIRFNEDISINEDHLFVLTYYNYVKNICTIDNLSYYYYYDFTVPSLTKTLHSHTEYLNVSALISDAYHKICIKYGFTSHQESVLKYMFGPDQSVKALISCVSSNESISSFCLCEEYLINNFGLRLDDYNKIYRPYLRILSLKTKPKVKYDIFKIILFLSYIIKKVKYVIKLLVWHNQMKHNKL